MKDSQFVTATAAYTPEQRAALVGLAEAANEKLLDAGQAGTNYAFNLGCYLGLLPVGIFTAVVFVISRKSWAAAGITFLIAILVMVALANTAAFIAGRNTLQRTYTERVAPEIESKLAEILPDFEIGLSQMVFWKIANEILPAGSPLLQFTPPDGTQIQEISTPE